MKLLVNFMLCQPARILQFFSAHQTVRSLQTHSTYPIISSLLALLLAKHSNNERKKKMGIITLRSIKSILSTMGLLSSAEQTSSQTIISYWLNVLYTIPLLALLVPLVAYFYANMVNLIKATDAFYVIAATLMCIGQYWFLVLQKPELSRLVVRLQNLVDQSTICTNFDENHFIRFKILNALAGESSLSYHVYKSVEMKISRFTIAMKAFVIISSSICLFLPFVFAGFHFVMGVYQPDDWYLPYRTMWVEWDYSVSDGISFYTNWFAIEF